MEKRKNEFLLDDLLDHSTKKVISDLKNIKDVEFGLHETIISLDIINQIAHRALIEIDELKNFEFTYQNSLILQSNSFITISFIYNEDIYEVVINLENEHAQVIAKKSKDIVYIYDFIKGIWVIPNQDEFDLQFLKEVK